MLGRFEQKATKTTKVGFHLCFLRFLLWICGSLFHDWADPVVVLGCLKSARLEHGLLINFGSYKFEMRKLAWWQDRACRKSKPTFLLSAVFAFFAFFTV